MKHKPNNPRRISPKEFERLRADLTTFGDLSGIVHNVTTGNLVGGNQRTRASCKTSALMRSSSATSMTPPRRYKRCWIACWRRPRRTLKTLAHKLTAPTNCAKSGALRRGSCGTLVSICCIAVTQKTRALKAILRFSIHLGIGNQTSKTRC